MAETTEKSKFEQRLREQLVDLLDKKVEIKSLDDAALRSTIVFVGDDYLVMSSGGIPDRLTLIALAHVVSFNFIV